MDQPEPVKWINPAAPLLGGPLVSGRLLNGLHALPGVPRTGAAPPLAFPCRLQSGYFPVYLRIHNPWFLWVM